VSPLTRTSPVRQTVDQWRTGRLLVSADVREIFRAAGEVGRDLLAVDWTATPLGPAQAWPQSLTTIVGALLGSRFAMWMAWGPELTFFCNDAYRRHTLGSKYPWALGRPAGEVWAEIWPDIGPRIDTVLESGVATWDDGLLLFLERSGYVEETYHTFSYSPLTGDDGRIDGMLCVVSEETERVIGQRRLRLLSDLGATLTAAHTEADVLADLQRTLGADQRSLPFTVTYLVDDDTSDDTVVRLAAATGIAAGHPAAPEVLDVRAPTPCWPAAQVLADGATVVVDDLTARFAGLPTGAWDEPPNQALVLPLPRQGQGYYGFLVAGLNPYRPLDAGYRGFLELLCGQLAAGVANARSREAERRRAETLEQLDRAKTAFFTNVSHEFRTPLTLLLGPTEDALADRDDPLSPGQRQRTQVVRRNAQRLLQLVNTLLDFSRLESGQEAASFEPTDLASYTAELASMFETAIAKAGLTLTVDCAPLPEPVHVDREMWAKVVLNLLSNAVKFTFTGGITVSVHAEGGMAELAVTDTGTGIPPAEQARLFERFHRIAGARGRTHEGSGIGLALVAELAHVHGGSAGVDSTPGVGSRFTVRLPFGSAHLPVDQLVEASDGEAPAARERAAGYVGETLRWLGADAADQRPVAETSDPEDPAGGRPRVLVVDDNSDMRDYIVGLLKDDYAVMTAPDGAAGLELARDQPPDLVLTDVMMPNLDGFGLLAALHADPATTGIPVVMLSARAGEGGTVEGLEAGADDYLAKPFAARELLARVRANLELDRSRRVRAELERHQELLDEAQLLAHVGSWQIDLDGGAVSGTEEYFRLLGVDSGEFRFGSLPEALQGVHPDDLARATESIDAAMAGAPIDVEFRVLTPENEVRRLRALGRLRPGSEGGRGVLRGSLQDVTEEREAERARADAAAAHEVARREQGIADELQRNLLPPHAFDPEHLEVATYYRAGVEGTQVGGDWYDVIELGAGRTALVIGDVMGRGVHAAAVMGQLRAAARAYARLDLPPADVLDLLDAAVRDLGDDQIVTCVYAVYDPADHSLVYASAGHLPPMLAAPGQPVMRLAGTAGPPLGTGVSIQSERRVTLPVGAVLALYTDGLVERRDRDLDTGLDALADQLAAGRGALAARIGPLVDTLLPDGPDDDIAVLLARVTDEAQRAASVSRHVDADQRAVADARSFVTSTLLEWRISGAVAHDVVLLASELVTNAIVHGRPPIELRLRRTAAHIVLSVADHAAYLPRRLRPTSEDEHGRGLQLVALLADRWGTRPTPDGKSVWCMFSTGTATQHHAGSPLGMRSSEGTP
jgi:signal transduction histidine kinase/DNA-binding response OmpR family regulator